MVSLVWLPDGEKKTKKFDDMFSCFDRIPAYDRRMDKRTSCNSIVCTMHRAVKNHAAAMLTRADFEFKRFLNDTLISTVAVTCARNSLHHACRWLQPCHQA